MKDYINERNRLYNDVCEDLLELLETQGEQIDDTLLFTKHKIGLNVSDEPLDVDRYLDYAHDYPLTLCYQDGSLGLLSKDKTKFEYLQSIDDLCYIAGYLCKMCNL